MDVELGKEFQDPKFGTEMLALTSHGLERMVLWTDEPVMRGDAVVGFEYNEVYYLLWVKDKLRDELKLEVSEEEVSEEE